MNRHQPRETDAGRRALLRQGWRLATGAAAMGLAGVTRAGADAPAPRVSFLGREAGADALAHAPGDTYYSTMRMLESRARTNSPLTGLSVAEARVAVRDYEAAAVREFTPAEAAAIRAAVEHLQPLLAERAPLYARTPWSFIKLAADAEGGMPHTRGAHIVLPENMAAGAARLGRDLVADDPSKMSRLLRNLLVHEQTHVLERAHPDRFEPLITQVFGFTRMSPAPSTQWLDVHEFENPDGPEVVWAFALDRIGGSGWVMPHLVVPDMAQPRMPDDFRTIGVEVRRTDGGWQVVEDGGVPRARDLDRISGWHAHFPFPDEDFHPNEIAAVTLAHWILRDVPDVDNRPLIPAVAAWARTGLA